MARTQHSDGVCTREPGKSSPDMVNQL